MKRILVLVFFSCIFFWTQVSAGSINQIAVDYQSRITEYSLENGMRFLIIEDRSAPVVTFHVQVRAGSVYEKPRETGVNHLIEHLAFSGTTKIGTLDWQKEEPLLKRLDELHLSIIQAKKEDLSSEHIQSLKREFEQARRQAADIAEPNQFASILSREGAVGPNAFVNRDFTVYWVEMPSNKFELWASFESERLFNSVLRMFYEEIEIVKEERRAVVDNSPMGKLMEEFRQAAYQVHPYRHPVIGYMEDIKTMNRARVKQLYDKYYVPSNMTVSIVGDVSAEEIKPMLDKYFSVIPAREKPSFKLPQEPERKAERRVYLQMDSQPILVIGFNIPDAVHSDIAALRVASEIIGKGRVSRLYQKLVKEEQVAVAVESWAQLAKYPGLFYIWAIAADGFSNKDIEPLIRAEINKLLNEPPSREEVEGARARLKMDFIQSLKSRRRLASNLAWYEDVAGSWQEFFKSQKLVALVEPEDIVEVLKRYFSPDNRTVGSLEPFW